MNGYAVQRINSMWPQINAPNFIGNQINSFSKWGSFVQDLKTFLIIKIAGTDKYCRQCVLTVAVNEDVLDKILCLIHFGIASYRCLWTQSFCLQLCSHINIKNLMSMYFCYREKVEKISLVEYLNYGIIIRVKIGN